MHFRHINFLLNQICDDFCAADGNVRPQNTQRIHVSRVVCAGNHLYCLKLPFSPTVLLLDCLGLDR